MKRGSLAFFVLISGCAAVVVAQDSPTRAPNRPGSTSAPSVATTDHRPHAGMLRFPDVSAKLVTFVYANDLWTVPREGGVATPLASPPGAESFPRFSPDGSTIAFVGNYDGNQDLYTVAVGGGTPRRVTHHPETETLCDWTPDGKSLMFFTNGFAGLARQQELWTVSADGGLPGKLPVPYGANGAISADGQWLAYTLHTADGRTWKRYRGGMSTDVWLFHLKDLNSKKITDWEGTDSQPMWNGKTVYYMSDDGPEHRLNLWSYDSASGKREQVTHLKDFDVKWPAMGPGADGGGEIVFQAGSELQILDLKTRKSRTVDVMIPGDRPKIRPRDVEASKFVQGWNISPTGKRGVFEARGDVWTAPAKFGTARNLTRTNGVAERDPAWSPDGEWIAYFGDESGEYELYVLPSDGKGAAKKLTSDGTCFRNNPTWSPDSKRLAFSDKTGAMFVHTIEGGETKLIDTEPWANAGRMSWSPDSIWITYLKGGDNRLASTWLYNVNTAEKHQITSGRFDDHWPTFDRKGDFLYLTSSRKFVSPAYEDVGTTFVYADTELLLAIPLRKDVKSPWAPKNDEELYGKAKEEEQKKEAEKKDAEKKEGDKKDSDKKDGEKKEPEKKEDDKKDPDKKDPPAGEPKNDDETKKTEAGPAKSGDDAKKEDGEEKKGDKKAEVKPITIDVEGLERRAIIVPVPKGRFMHLAVNHEGKLLYVRQLVSGTEGRGAIKILDPNDEEKKEKNVLEDVDNFILSADGKKLMVRKEETTAIVDAAPDQKLDKPMNLKGMTVTVDPRTEWKQMFREAWRIQRDFFYDPNMHGVGWDAQFQQYSKMLEDCASREDLSYVIGEMISELNVGHAYVRGGGDMEESPQVPVGLLGADFELKDGAYRIARIVEGGKWDVDARGPLSQPGVDAKVGDYVLAVNGTPIDAAMDPWASFQGLAGKTVTVTLSEKPKIDESARTVTVELLKTEQDLRFRAWIERNRAYVEEKTGGKVGYIYVPNTGVEGQNELFRQFFGQIDKQALIVDERWNGGGQIPTRFVELLNRPVANYWAKRDGNDWTWPPDSHAGPKCMLINGLAGSGGDYFPWYFKNRGVGKLIGTRTWGGLVGISGNPQLVDTGRTTSPTFAFYETDGTWGIEGHGVDPDIMVIDDPALMVNGGDPQLDASIKLMLDEVQRNPYKAAKRPAYPNRRGMGIREEDK